MREDKVIMKRTMLWMGVLGCSLLTELFLECGNSDILAQKAQNMYLLQQEQVTGTAVTVTDSAVVTKEAVVDVPETPAAEIKVDTQMELVPQAAENMDESVSVSQTDTVINASLKKKNVKLGMGELVKMPVKNRSGIKVTYSSKNKRVISVNKKGVMRGRKLGMTEVYVKVATKTLHLKAQVKKKPTSVKIKVPKRSSVKIGTKIILKVSLNKGSASYKIRWSSSKRSVATVNASGVLLVKGKGRTTITAKTYNGKKAKIVFVIR